MFIFILLMLIIFAMMVAGGSQWQNKERISDCDVTAANWFVCELENRFDRPVKWSKCPSNSVSRLLSKIYKIDRSMAVVKMYEEISYNTCTYILICRSSLYSK